MTARAGAQVWCENHQRTWALRLNSAELDRVIFAAGLLGLQITILPPSRDLTTRSTIPARMGGGTNGSAIPGIYFQEGGKKKHKNNMVSISIIYRSESSRSRF